MTHPIDASRIDRRHFLTASAAAATLGPAVALAAGQSKPVWKMKLSTSSLHYRSLPLVESCQRISRLGFQGIDVWAHFEWAGPLCEHLEEGVERMGPEEFATLLKHNNLALFSASCYSVAVSKFAPLLGKMGGCVIVRGSQPVQGAPESITLGELKSQMKQFLELLKPDLDAAAGNNCSLAIENHSGRSLLNKLDSIKLFTELNKNERLGIALAPFHIQANKESVEQSILAAGKQLKFFYAWQHGEGTQQLPGIGPTDCVPWLQALARIDYQGYVNPFMHHEPEPDEMDQALAKSREYLLKLNGE